MNQNEKSEFIVTLIANVQESVLANVERMPDDWDGHELRRYIADVFEQCNGLLAKGKTRMQGQTKRLRAYRNEVLTRNL